MPIINQRLKATELTLLQHLNKSSLPHPGKIFPATILDRNFTVPWLKVEHLLRNYAEYQLGRSFRSVTIIDSLPSTEF